MTPLIDVVFILLVFFMLASSFTNWRSIDLRTPGVAGTGSTMEGAVLIEVREQGLRLAGEAVALDELGPRLEQIVGDDFARAIWIRPAPGVPLQPTVAVLDRLADAGLKNLTLIRAPGS